MENSENDFGLSAEDREAINDMKQQKAEALERKERSKLRDLNRKGLTDDEGTGLLYSSYGLKEELDNDESILDSTAAIKLAVRTAQGKLNAERSANQIQNQPTGTPPTEEPGRQQVNIPIQQVAQPDEKRLIPANETMESLKAMGYSTAKAAVVLKFNKTNMNLT